MRRPKYNSKSKWFWIVAIGIFVYWGAAYPTLGNILTYIFDKLEPVGVVIDKYTNIAIDHINTQNDTETNRLINRILLGCSCLALVLSVVYRFALKKVAAERHYTAELNSLIQDAGICVLLTLFAHNTVHWWSIIAVPIFAFIILYPLLYIPYYRYFRWVYDLPYILIVVNLGITVAFIQFGGATLLGKILGIICTIFAAIHFVEHTRLNYCPKCKKYTNLDTLCIVDNTKIKEWKDGTTRQVATGYTDTYKVDSHGNKTLVSRVATGYETVEVIYRRITHTWWYKYTCPCCNHSWDESGVEEE
ncbi:MAG: hypothetical protein IKD41_04320 [Alistipes sp.]|nr:hypothetical protein [Alistipes sp.]